ncbi:MAG: TRAP transporter substrate-binding protein DctP [Acetobacteraceae bacterium]
MRAPVEAAEKIGRESGGRLVVQVYPNNQLGGDTQMLAQVRSGALELLMTGDNILANIVPVASVSDLPFAFAGYKDLWTAMDGPLETTSAARSGRWASTSSTRAGTPGSARCSPATGRFIASPT